MDDFLPYVINQRFQLPSQPKTSKDPVFWLEKKHFVTISLQEDPDSRIVGGKKDYEEGLQGFGGFHLFGDMAISALRIMAGFDVLGAHELCCYGSFGSLYIFDPHLECVSKWNPWVFPTFYESFLSLPEYFRIPKHVKGDVDAQFRDFLSRNRRSNLSLWPQWVHALLEFRVPRRSLWKLILWPVFFLRTNFPMQNKMPP